MYDHQDELRSAAHRALEARGFVIESERYGGARVSLSMNGKRIAAAVRTSANRLVGWMRDDRGEWRAMSDADLIVVAAFDNETRPTKIEVFGFDPKDLRAAFNARLAANREKNPKFSNKAPVFVRLDPAKPGRRLAGKDLKKHLLWLVEFSISKGPDLVSDQAVADKEVVGLTIAMAKQGLASTYGVSPDAIEIVIRG